MLTYSLFSYEIIMLLNNSKVYGAHVKISCIFVED